MRKFNNTENLAIVNSVSIRVCFDHMCCSMNFTIYVTNRGVAEDYMIYFHCSTSICVNI